jgi:TPR repeat protein
MKAILAGCARKFERYAHRILLIILILTLSACNHLPGLSSPAADALKQKANEGDPVSQYQLGLRYSSGTGVWQSDSTAAEWFERAAIQGNADAAYMLGIDYYTGRGVAQDYFQASRWFEQAAEQGHPRAQYQLAAAYMNGQGIKRDQAWAARWYGKAANQGHADAQFSLGVAFARGLGLPVHPLQACKWLILADKSNTTQARQGAVKDKVCSGLKKDQQQRAEYLAKRWRPRAADTGYADSPTIFYIQYRLLQLGYKPGYADGFQGPQTDRAIDHYLKGSGISSRPSNKAIVNRLRKASG